EAARTAELGRRHAAQARQQSPANGVQARQVSCKAQSLYLREVASCVAIRMGQQRDHVGGVSSLPKNLDVQPVGLDQREMVKNRPDAIAASSGYPVDRTLVHASERVFRPPAPVLKCPEPAPNLRVVPR